ncbi:MAG TPA: GNAT family N-acetyltransferase [Jatrophihabitantaceae bacterium]
MKVGVVDASRTRELRRAVLRPHLTLADELPGDDQPDAVHIAAIDGDEVVGTCFIYREPCPWRPGPGWRLRSMATAPERQRAGIGAAVLAGAGEYVAEHGGGTLWLHAREVAVSFYARHGLLLHGEPYVENNLPHRHMWRAVENLSAAPTRPS